MYDPEQYWDAKAQAAENAAAAVRIGDPALDRCIERTQRQLIVRAIHQMKAAGVGSDAGSAVLDFGCGTGQWTKLLQEQFATYAGTDISARMLEAANASHAQHEFQQLVDGQLPFGDAQFDAVFSIAVLHHNDYPQQESLLAEIRRVIRDGGWLALLEGVGDTNTDANSHFYYRPPEGWKAVLEKHRFHCVSATNCRYGLFWYLLERLEDRLLRSTKANQKRTNQESGRWREALRRAVLRFDFHVDHRLLDLIPNRVAGRRMMLLQAY